MVDQEIKGIRGMGIERHYPPHVFINNKKLVHLLEYFVNNKCLKNCKLCNHCEEISEQAIIKNEPVSKYLTFLYSKLNEKMLGEKETSGDN